MFKLLGIPSDGKAQTVAKEVIRYGCDGIKKESCFSKMIASDLY